MSEKLKLLLDKIGLNNEDQTFFNNGQILKLVIDKNAKIWNFIIKLDEPIDVRVIKEFEQLLSKSYSELKEVYATFEYEKNDNNKIEEYFKYILSKVNIHKMFEHHKTSFDNQILTIKVLNKIEFNKINKLKEKIEFLFKRYGFDITLNIVIDEEEQNAIKQEIDKDTFIKVEPTKEINPVIIGNEIKTKRILELRDVIEEESSVVIEAYVFASEFKEIPGKDFKIATFKLSDNTDSLNAKFFTRDNEEFNTISSRIKNGNWYRIRGGVKNDLYLHDLVLNIRDMQEIPSKDIVREDDAPVKRVELHAHTHMSQMDGLVSVTDLAARAAKWGHKAIAITDHNGCQAFTDAYLKVKGINIIYGVEMNMIDDNIDIVLRETDARLDEETFVVFDFETTGFNATSGDSIIEVGAVKICNGEIIDAFQEFVNPGREISEAITNITSITNEMLKDKDVEETVIKRFKEWYGNLPMVAHNAKFDVSFLESAYHKYNLGTFSNPVIDTLELSKALDTNVFRHSLSAIVKRYDVPFDEEGHHRADYDAKATALVFHKMIKKLMDRNIERISDIKTLISKEDIHKYGRPYHVTLLAKNQVGLKNLFRLVSLSNTKYLYKTPRILRSEIINNREGLLIGSSCANGEIFTLARSKSDDETNALMSFYDYIEIQPLSIYNYLVDLHDFANEMELQNHVEKIIRIALDNKKIVVATGDVHQLDKEDNIYREIIINQKVPGGGRHPLSRDAIKNIPNQYFMTTNEMLEAFSFLDKDLAYEIVVTNTNKIADMIEPIVVIKNSPKPLSPKMEDSDKIVRDLTYNRAHSLYGEKLPDIVQDRIEKELSGIIGGGFDVIYLIAQKLVKKSNDDGYLVGSRGSVGSSFVAHMMGITEVNALPAHYLCPNCKKSIFEDEDGKSLGSIYASGYDLPDKKCDCGTMMHKEGQDMPFATFLGFNADKVPDIDLNFSGDYQSIAHDYTKELFGEDYVFRAGTIGTVAEKTALGFVKGYLEKTGKTMRFVEQERLALGCAGVKRTTGQHPGGIIVIPNYMDVLDFTPYQYPADDVTSKWYTTHFDYHPMENDLLKLDILGHDDPTVLKMLQDLSGIDITSIPLDDKKVLSIFSSTEALGVTKEQILSEVGTYGIPEFGTKFVMDMLVETKPKTFAELVKISGLSHGTDVWRGNAQELIKNNIVPFSEVIGCRDDIMVYLSYNGVEPIDAFKIMEFVRKGRPSKQKEEWNDVWVPKMKEKKIEDWYIDSCTKIKYMFPKAHAVAYVMMACRVAWFKVHKPLYYYAAYLSVRCHDFDIETMIKGYDAIKARIVEIQNKGFDKTNKEEDLLDVLYTTLELTARGFKIGEIDLYKSDAVNFVIEGNTLIPPFRTIDGLGNVVARKIVEEREKINFISIEDFQKRSKASQTIIDKMRVMGVFKDMPETNQLTLF
ncbi:MAG TPA: PolC-type DNA polymerase III [Mollicutes bacterium]|nr:PolC-type DNA polymerase III [Mollicutes bacterium]